ncbi:MAG: hypothetical protein EBS34_11460 [Flavobacteriales bacterium]|nr:hypothetical protein [Flavobacteriales bacterium]
MKTHILIYLFSAVSVCALGQKKVTFKDKTIGELEIGIGYNNPDMRTTFPDIWDDFEPYSENYIFSGYYTLDPKSTAEEVILNGEVKLTKIELGAAEGTMNYKEVLSFNFVNGEMNGNISYNFYSSEYNEETEETNLDNVKWVKQASLSAVYDGNEGVYRTINFMLDDDVKREKYTITRRKAYQLYLSNLWTIIDLNTCTEDEKPVFSKVKY